MALVSHQTAELAAIDRAAMQILDALPHLCDAVISDLRAQIVELEHIDSTAIAALQQGIEQSYQELCSLLRSGLPVAGTLPVGALECATKLREWGLGLVAAQSAQRLSLSLFRRAASALARSAAPDDAIAAEALADVDSLLSEYWEQLVAALGDAYQTGRSHDWQHFGADDPPSGATATDTVIASQTPDDSRLAERVHARSEAILDQFCAALQNASAEPRVGAKLASADTTVVIALSDEDDICATLLLDREPIEVARGRRGSVEAEIRLTSVDLERLFTEDFHLSMAMARGRVEWNGRVRKFLRLAPVIGEIVAGGQARAKAGTDERA